MEKAEKIQKVKELLALYKEICMEQPTLNRFLSKYESNEHDMRVIEQQILELL